MAGVNLFEDDPQEGTALFDDQPRNSGGDLFVDPENGQVDSNQGIPETTNQGFMAGFNQTEAKDVSLTLKAGGFLAEQVSDPELVEANRQSKKFEEWQPRIWDAEDKLNSITDKHTDEYQNAHEELKNLRKNFTDDMNGTFEPEEDDFNFAEFASSIKDNFGFMSGVMAKTMISDPALLLIPGGWIKSGQAALNAVKTTNALTQAAAKTAGQIAGAAGVGTALGASTSVIEQLDKNPDAAIDFNRVADTAIVTAAFSGVLPVLGVAVKPILGAAKVPLNKISEVMDTAKIKKIELRAQKFYNDNIVDGVPELNRQAAVERAILKFNPTPETAAKVLPDMEIYMSEVALANRAAKDASKGFVGRGVDAAGNAAEQFGDFFNYMTQPVTSTLRAMGLPHIAKALNEHDMNIGTDLTRKQEIGAVFSKEYGNLSEAEQAVVAINLNNGTYANVANNFSEEMNASVANVRKMLDAEHAEMVDAGMKVGKTENYFPREKDYARWVKDNGVDQAAINGDLARAVNDKLNLQGRQKLSASDMSSDMIRRHLSEQDIGKVLNKHATRSQGETISGSTNSLKSRTIDDVLPDQQHYYQDPRASLHNHINRVTPKIHDRKFFGGKKIDEDIEGLPGTKPDDSTLIGAYIDDHVARLQTGGDILSSDMQKVSDILHSRFIKSRKQSSTIVNGTKNILYAAALGNPLAASTQLGDLGAAAYMNGYTKAINGMIGEAIEGTRFKMSDFGLEAIPELETMGATRRALDWSLKLGGFRAMDRLGKETILNSTFTKLKSVIDDPKLSGADKFKYFKERYGQRLGESEVRDIMRGIASGDTKNPHTRLALYSDLTRVQPVSMSEMPRAYMDHPNARIFFMLKTFTLKQIDLMRNEVINNLRNGAKDGSKRDVAKAALNLGKLAGTIGAANFGVEWTKSWLQGNEKELPNAAMNTILRNYGLSQYDLEAIMKGNIVETATNIAAPPYRLIQDPIKELMGVDTRGRWVDSIPLVGRTARFIEKVDENF